MRDRAILGYPIFKPRTRAAQDQNVSGGSNSHDQHGPDPMGNWSQRMSDSYGPRNKPSATWTRIAGVIIGLPHYRVRLYTTTDKNVVQPESIFLDCKRAGFLWKAYSDTRKNSIQNPTQLAKWCASQGSTDYARTVAPPEAGNVQQNHLRSHSACTALERQHKGLHIRFHEDLVCGDGSDTAALAICSHWNDGLSTPKDVLERMKHMKQSSCYHLLWLLWKVPAGWRHLSDPAAPWPRNGVGFFPFIHSTPEWGRNGNVKLVTFWCGTHV